MQSTTRPESNQGRPSARWGGLLALGLAACGRDRAGAEEAAAPAAVGPAPAGREAAELSDGGPEAADEQAVAGLREAAAGAEAEFEGWRFLVRTASGRPAGGLGWGMWQDGRSIGLEPLVVDAAGRMELSLDRLEAARIARGSDSEAAVVLRAPFLGAPSVEVALPDSSQGAPIAIEVPDHGSLEVQLADARGDDLAVEQTVRAYLNGPGAAPGVADLPREARVRSVIAGSAGSARIEPLALGHQVTLDSDATEGLGKSLVIQGPIADGECIQVRLEGRERLPEMRLRLVDAAGQPLVDRMILVRGRASLAEFTATLNPLVVKETTDGEGLLRFHPGRSSRGVGLQWLELQEQRGERRAAAVRLPNVLEGLDQLELGTVVLGPEETVVAGRLLNGFGVPFKDANFELVRLPEPLGPGPVLWEEYLDPDRRREPPGFVELRRWVPDAELRADGSFELSGFRFLDGESLALRVEPRSGPVFLHAVEAGDLEAEVRAPAGSGLLLEVAADWDELLWGSLRLTLKGSEIGYREHQLAAAMPRVKLSLEPDPAVRIELLAYSVLLHTFDEVEIRDGAPTDLGTVDLRGRVDSFEIDVRTEAGEFLWEVDIMAEASGGEFLYVGAAMENEDRHRCIRPPDVGAWWIVAPGYRDLRLDELVADQVVTLLPGVPLELDLGEAETAALPEARLVPIDRTPCLSWRPVKVRFDAEGRFRLPLPADGWWRLEWYTPGADPSREEPLEVLEFDVPPGGTTLRVSAPGE